MSTTTWFYRITKTFPTRTEAWLKGDMLSYRGPMGGKFSLDKLGPREFSMTAVVSSETVERGDVELILGTDAYGISPIIVEEKAKAS